MLENLRYIRDVAGTPVAVQAVREKLGARMGPVCVTVDGIRHPVWMRARSSDVPAFQQVFRRAEYAFETRRAPRAIVDAGANVGYASIWFANRYPNARIVALEPDPGNFALLKRNVEPYPNVVPVLGALWSEDCEIEVVDRGTGDWGFMTQAAGSNLGPVRSRVPAFAVGSLMARYDLERVDVFKMDIEGAEREVFAAEHAWLERVDSLIVELHDRIKPGCSRAFCAATVSFDEEWWQGENIYLTRAGGCIVPSAGAASSRICGPGRPDRRTSKAP